MKRVLTVLMLSLGLLSVAPAQAHWHGGYGGGYGWPGGWVAPVVGAAIVGSAIYAATTPHYVVSAPPVVVGQPPVVRSAYFCPTSQQYYPNAPVCNVPWQVVSY